MNGLKQTVFSAAASVSLLCLPMTPAAAHEHFHGGPCILGNVIGAVATLVTLPLVVASAAVSALQPPAPYAPAPSYYGAPAGYYAPRNYYAQPPAYYPQSPGYYAAPQAQTYYRPPVGYAYTQPGGHYGPRPIYPGSYVAHAFPGPGGSPYRRW